MRSPDHPPCDPLSIIFDRAVLEASSCRECRRVQPHPNPVPRRTPSVLDPASKSFLVHRRRGHLRSIHGAQQVRYPVPNTRAVAATTHGFAPATPSATASRAVDTRLHAKGFGAPPPAPREKSAGQVDRDAKESKYDEIAETGGQEYRIFVRKFGSDDESWLPVGSIAVPRNAQVSDAIFANEEGLRTSIVRTYDKLKGMEMEFEYGYNLKVYPDDPVQVAMKGKGGGGGGDGPSIGNWISNLLSPVDASGVAPPPMGKE